MIDFFKRSELVRRGLASGKLRRRRARNGLLRGLEYSWGMKGVLFTAFIAGLAVLIFSGNQPEPTKNFVIALLFFLIALMMLWVNQPRTFSQNSRILLMFGFIGPINLFPPTTNDWPMIGLQSAFAIGNGIVTATIVGGVIPMFEPLFQITTDISWLEASDLNHPLLRRMTIEAPGTYHHSLVVANLAEAAAEAIGANATLCRVCSYFHDVGKLVKPEYFTENMNFERNPHDDLAPTMSALIIIAHVKEGVDLALKHKLNQRVIDIIQEHHGTSLVRYFYQRALQQHEDARAGGKIMKLREDDIPEVREESFRYSGPKPQTKESAIVSLADTVESASRSLEKPTPQKIESLVNELIEERISDRQLDDCDLTLGELKVIADRFRFTLLMMLHSRIAYPRHGAKTHVVAQIGRAHV